MKGFIISSFFLAATAGLGGCFWAAVGGAAEGGYVAGQKEGTGTVVSDQWITTKVKSKLIADGKVKARNIQVTTIDAVVTLRGIVFSQEEEKRAISLAKDSKGVKSVVSHLKLSE